MRNSSLKVVVTIVGAIGFSTLGIYAADTLQGIDGGGQLASLGGSGICMEGAAPVTVSGKTICVDVYEASPSEGCPYIVPRNAVESEGNASSQECYAASVKNASPWTYVSLPQAQRICASAGKRLPTSEEWYHIALGTDVASCEVNAASAAPTGSGECTSGTGVYDAIGNVWEWVDGEVQGNKFNERELPAEGYVTSVDASGVALTTTDTPDALYGEDYVWTKTEGVFGILRGGYYGSGDDAGLYTLNASVPTSFATLGVGFRCVKDVY